MRWSAFQTAVDASEWTDPGRVLEHAKSKLELGEAPGSPVLTYDGVPDRLAWAVPVIGRRPGVALYVAGSAVWRGPWPTGPSD